MILHRLEAANFGVFIDKCFKFHSLSKVGKVVVVGRHTFKNYFWNLKSSFQRLSRAGLQSFTVYVVVVIALATTGTSKLCYEFFYTVQYSVFSNCLLRAAFNAKVISTDKKAIVVYFITYKVTSSD